MTLVGNVEQQRAALRMINPAPYNAEAPAEALVGEITPTEFHYVRSNFAVPDHDGTLEIGGAVDNATTLTPDPVHSAFYDSHPPAPARIARLQSAA